MVEDMKFVGLAMQVEAEEMKAGPEVQIEFGLELFEVQVSSYSKVVLSGISHEFSCEDSNLTSPQNYDDNDDNRIVSRSDP